MNVAVAIVITTFLSVFGITPISAIQVGDSLPNMDLLENTPSNHVNVAQLFAGKKGVLFAVAGAFCPGEDKTQLPGYVDNYDNFKAKGVDVMVCVSVNDPFVMAAWGESKKTAGKIRMLADIDHAFATAVGMELDATPFLGNIRSKRYALIVEDGVVQKVFAEPDGTGLTVSLADNVLAQL